MRIPILLAVLLLQQYCQGQAYMPSNAPAPASLGAARGALSGATLKYNDGSYLNEKSGDIKGNPFLSDEWQTGTVILKTKQRFDSLLLKYDLLSDKLIAKIDEQQLQFTAELAEFWIPDTVVKVNRVFRNGFAAIGSFDEKSFYQVLYDGKTKLLYKNKKTIITGLTSTPGVKEKIYDEQPSYYIVTSQGIVKRIRKRNKQLADLFPDRSEDLRKKIEAGHSNTLNDAELISLVKYYDSLQ